jgi:hypothetical protein
MATAVLAAVALVAFAIAGHLRAGLAIDLGLVIGALNGPMIQRSVEVGAFGALAFGRLILLSLVGVGLGLVLGIDVLWLVVVGLAAAQLVLAGTGFWQMMRR